MQNAKEGVLPAKVEKFSLSAHTERALKVYNRTLRRYKELAPVIEEANTVAEQVARELPRDRSGFRSISVKIDQYSIYGVIIDFMLGRDDRMDLVNFFLEKLGDDFEPEASTYIFRWDYQRGKHKLVVFVYPGYSLQCKLVEAGEETFKKFKTVCL